MIIASTQTLEHLLRNLDPVLNDGVYVYASTQSNAIGYVDCLASMRESEGVTVITTPFEAKRAGLKTHFEAAWITLKINSDLHAVGLTAAFSGALARAGISCNVIAGVHHDHLFVPYDQAANAMACLRQLQSDPR